MMGGGLATPFRVVLRADASRTTGVGHVMRSLTIGQELVAAGISVTLASAELDPPIRHRPAACGVEVTTVRATPGSAEDAQAVADLAPDLVILDGYFFRPEFHSTLRTRQVPTMVVDDDHQTDIRGAEIVLNPNPHATLSMYDGQLLPETLVLVGPRFALVRREICQVVARPDVRHHDPHSVLVAIGGTDVLGLTTALVDHLSTVPGLDVCAPVLAAQSESQLPEIADELSRSAVAVIGAGGMLWEACALGVPTVALIVADNQEPGALSAQQHGATFAIDCRDGAPFELITSVVSRLMGHGEDREALSAAGQGLIDCGGAARVARGIVGYLSAGAER